MNQIYVNPCKRCFEQILPRTRKGSLCQRCEKELIRSDIYFYSVSNGKYTVGKNVYHTLINDTKNAKDSYQRLYSQVNKQYLEEASVFKSELDRLKSYGILRILLFTIFGIEKVNSRIAELEEQCISLRNYVFGQHQVELNDLETEWRKLDEQKRDCRIALQCGIPEKQWRYHQNLLGVEALSTLTAKDKSSSVLERTDKVFQLFGDVITYAKRHTDFVRRKRDYRRGNLIDNFVRNDWYSKIFKMSDECCAHCEAKENLQLDHFWLPKNEGGNFVMLHASTHRLVANVILLCSSCNASKQDTDIWKYLKRFKEPTVAKFIELQIATSIQLMQDIQLVEIASRWYASGVSTLATIVRDSEFQ